VVSAPRCLLACVLLSLLVPVGTARGQDIWTIGARSTRNLVDVTAGPDGYYLALAATGDDASAVLRVDASGTIRRLARIQRSCQAIAALADGGAVVACEDALLRVRADGRQRRLAIRWAITVRYVDAVATARAGILVAVVTGDGDGQVYRAGFDGTAARVAGGGTRPATTEGVSATELRLGELTSVAADEAGFVFVHEEAAGDLVRRVGEDGVVRTVAGGGPPTPLRDGISAQSIRLGMYLPYEGRPDVAVLPDGDVLLGASFIEGSTSVERLVRVDAGSGRLRILATPAFRAGFNRGDGRPLMDATLHPAALAAGASGDVAIVDGAQPWNLRWVDAPRAPRLAVAVTATRAAAPAISLHASHQARMTITVRHGGRTIRRLRVRGVRATVALGWLRTGTYAIRVIATDGQARRATDGVPLYVGRNPTSGSDCVRISALRVDCLHRAASLNDDEFGYVVVLRPDGQLWRAEVDPGSEPGDPVPPSTPWEWLE
jgi:hypothetical protein